MHLNNQGESMTIQISGHNIEITQVLHDFITKKFSRLEKHSARITSLHIILNVEKLVQFAEANIHIPGAEINAKAESDDMYKTIDALVDKVIKQLDKHKGKHEDKRR